VIVFQERKRERERDEEHKEKYRDTCSRKNYRITFLSESALVFYERREFYSYFARIRVIERRLFRAD
jgi:hypothetical protein